MERKRLKNVKEWDLTAPSYTVVPESRAHNSIISLLPIFAQKPPEHLAFTRVLCRPLPLLGSHFMHHKHRETQRLPVHELFSDGVQQGGEPADPVCQAPARFSGLHLQ